MFPLPSAPARRPAIHKRMLLHRRFILPLLLLIALLGASTAQADDPTPTSPSTDEKPKTYISQSRYGYVLINWDNIIKDLETDLDPRYKVLLGPVGGIDGKRWEQTLWSFYSYEYTAAKGMKPDTEYEVLVTVVDRWCRRGTCSSPIASLDIFTFRSPSKPVATPAPAGTLSVSHIWPYSARVHLGDFGSSFIPNSGLRNVLFLQAAGAAEAKPVWSSYSLSTYHSTAYIALKPSTEYTAWA